MVITCNGIKKSFANVEALKGLSTVIPSGKIFGLLGPNGAGKTTLIRIITQIIAADEGEILFGDAAIRESDMDRVGYLPEERGLFSTMKVGEHLQLLAELKGVSPKEATSRIYEMLERFNLPNWWQTKVQELSKGNQQLVQFIGTVLHNPELLILDEPFTGLDPVNSDLLEKELKRRQHDGTTIILSTHRMEQVEELCDQIAMVNKGEVILSGAVKEIRENYRSNRYIVRMKETDIQWADSQYPYTMLEDGRIVFTISTDEEGKDLLGYLIKKGFILSFEQELPSMHEIFIHKVQGGVL